VYGTDTISVIPGEEQRALMLLEDADKLIKEAEEEKSEDLDHK
jgi:hypothetical protein